MADAKVLGSSKKVKLDGDVFGAEFNGPLVHEVVVAEMAARRRGTHSTGVARPKMETLTLTRPRSKSSSSTTPLKLANGPSSTLTASPIS